MVCVCVCESSVYVVAVRSLRAMLARLIVARADSDHGEELQWLVNLEETAPFWRGARCESRAGGTAYLAVPHRRLVHGTLGGVPGGASAAIAARCRCVKSTVLSVGR